MSIHAMGQVWDLDLPPQEKLTLLAIADEAAGAEVQIRVRTFAAKTGIGERQIARLIKSLIERGILAMVPVPGPLPRRTPLSATYRIDLSRAPRKESFTP